MGARGGRRPGSAGEHARRSARLGFDEELISFESWPTGRLGVGGRREEGERGREPELPPVRAHGTPRPILIGAPPLPAAQAMAAAPASGEAASSRMKGEREALDGPTLDHAIPSAVPEDAPLDRDATERGLLAAIASGDETCRAIYADWLEERNEHARAGFLRLEQLVSRLLPGDPRLEACTRQLRELVQHIDPAWRARVARPRIEGCPAYAFRCPQRWDGLARTDREDVRYCSLCVKHVFYFEGVDEAREAARQGRCVAIDLGAERWEDDLVDLGVRCPGCARRIVSSARFCPHCGGGLRASAEHEVEYVIEVD